MIILTINTSQPEAEITIFNDQIIISEIKWQAHKFLTTTLNLTIKNLLLDNGLTFKTIEGLVFYKGPGSFTGLRIGASVVNSLAYGLKIPVVGTSKEDWQKKGIQKIIHKKNDFIIIPEYGLEAHITLAKK